MMNLYRMYMEAEGGDGGAGGGAGGDGGDSWVSSLPESLRDAPFIGKSATPEAALQEIQNAAAHVGNSLRLPSAEAGADDIAAFYTRVQDKVPGLMRTPDIDNAESTLQVLQALGMPTEANGYKYTAPEGQESPADLTGITALAHTAGLTQKQFQMMVAGINNAEAANAGDFQAELKADMDTLATEWGQALAQNQTIVKNFLDRSGAPDIMKEMVEKGELSSGEWKWLHSMAANTGNVAELTGQPAGGVVAMTPSEAENQIQEMLNNNQHPYWNAQAMGHKAAIDKMIELQKFRRPAS